MADAADWQRDPATGKRAWAVADGIGDDVDAAEAAEFAARSAVRAAVRGGAVCGVHAARAALREEAEGRYRPGDCVLVVAVPMSERVGGGWDIGWVGDCRAYVLREGRVEQVTEDHTEGQRMRGSADAFWRELAPGYDHIVTRSVLGGQPAASVRVLGPVDRLVLCTDGLYQAVTPGDLWSGMNCPGPPHVAARMLLRAAQVKGPTRDNATVTVVEPVPVEGS
ncbi:PP2C family protein-serine/threonine phosphatase [Streptomyces sp. NPDC051561]|uniref:PP2C family protein-serine/threonine phosphatase n=1 Tax=Streptomyces sp. NPDC051561 TaxID=3365658 RepID=UPI00378E68FE